MYWLLADYSKGDSKKVLEYIFPRHVVFNVLVWKYW